MIRVSRAAWSLAGLCALPTLCGGATFTVQLNNSLFGTVKQSDVPASNGPSGANSCAPTATADAFAFLQVQSPGTYDTSLVGGTSYNEVKATATTLASSAYMNTNSAGGTSATNWISGEVNYLENAAPEKTIYGGMGNFGINTTLYPWFTNADPTFSFLYNALLNQSGIELGMFPTSAGIGHVITLTGLNWNDANGNGVIDQSESATMTYMDPADGQVHASAIWQTSANSALQTDYYHAGQDSGYLVLATSAAATAPVAIVNNTTMLVSVNMLATQITGTGATTVAAATSLTASSIMQNSLTINGTVTIAATPMVVGSLRNPNATTSVVSNLNLAGGPTPTGTLNLNNNLLIIKDGGTAARDNVETLIAYARDGGDWDRPGITSANAQKAFANDGIDSLTLGVVLNSDLPNGPYSTFGSQPVSPNDVLVKFTYGGDSNLDGVVNGDDYFAIDQGFVNHYSGWINGDFNHDGVVNGDDYLIIDSNFINQAGQLAAPEVLAHAAMFGPSYLSEFSSAQLAAIGVPEPGSLILLGLGLTGAVVRRRKASKPSSPK